MAHPSEPSAWFLESVQPIEPMLRAWLIRRYSAGAEVDDIVQEAYARLWRARQRGDVHSPKAFLFATARNLALDHARHHAVAAARPLVDCDALDVMDEAPAIPETVALNQELALLHQAIQSLPERCREIFTLRKIHGLSQKEIGERLHISEHTVSAQLTIGLHKCTEFFARHASVPGPRA
ncbi:MAG TPA: RNA polymerase sigma factor [Opitutaceae bacterium]|nr:RNA polymerase sigma factor [Opitutaceae bacterium]